MASGAGPGAGRRADAGRSDRAGPAAARRGAARSRARSPKRSRPRTSKGIVHRDLKPANIKVTAGRHGQGARLRAREGRDRRGRRAAPPTLTTLATRAGIVARHAAYMSPEQARGQAGRQADGHLGVRLRALRDADGAACLRRRDGVRRHRGQSSRPNRIGRRCRPRPQQPVRALLARCLAKDSRAAAPRDCRCAVRSRRVPTTDRRLLLCHAVAGAG